MADPTHDLAKQARQGSIAAVIQFLNEVLADSGVRTRAVIAEGALQLLCEAEKAEQLDRITLVKHIQEILESIAPRNIRRVNINSRIVREQQLLWLEEISRDPENQLLWSEEIILAKPNLIRQLLEDLRTNASDRKDKFSLPKFSSPLENQGQKQFWQGILGGVGLILCLILLGWPLYRFLRPKSIAARKAQPSETTPQPIPTPSNSDTATVAATVAATQPLDPFVAAVRLAEQAAADGKVAQSSAQWLDLAAKWQQASDLMSQVNPKDNRYQTAQNRKSLYRKNSEYAQQQAQSNRTQVQPETDPAGN